MAPVWELDCSSRSDRIRKKGSHKVAAKLVSDWEEEDSGKLIEAMRVGQKFDEKNALIPIS
jgi:hypothetical protein